MRRVRDALLVAVLCMATAYGTLWAYTQWVRLGRKVVPAPLHDNTTLRRLFLSPSFVELMHAADSRGADSFDTVWDFDEAVGMSRRLFLPTDMFGEPRYRYRPHVGVYDLRVWSGLFYQSVVLEKTPEMTALVRRVAVELEVSFETDEHGFKPTGLAASADAPGVLFLGDSFTEGLWTAPTETFVARYGAQLQAEGRPESVMNLGVNGYGVLEMHWMLEHFGDDLHARLVIANLFPNDVGSDYLAVVRDDPAVAPPRNYASMFAHLEGMRAFAASHGITFVVCVIPAKEQLGALRGRDVFERRVRAWCETAGVRYLDPLPALDALGVETAYLAWDPHLAPAGHAAYARFLLDATRDLLPPLPPRQSVEGRQLPTAAVAARHWLPSGESHRW